MDWLKRLSHLRDDGQNKCKGMTKKEAGTFVSDTGGTLIPIRSVNECFKGIDW